MWETTIDAVNEVDDVVRLSHIHDPWNAGSELGS
jgi:hypothetical protein